MKPYLRTTWDRLTVLGIIILLGLAVSDFVSADSRDYRPPDNRPPPKTQPPGDVSVPVDVRVPVDVSVPVDINAPVDVSVPVDARSANSNSVDIEDKKQAPGFAIATPQDSLGFTVSTLVGGVGVNLPWTWGDRKKLPIYDRLMAAGNVGDANAVLCLTSVMRSIHETPELCETSLGGGSDEPGKNEAAQPEQYGPEPPATFSTSAGNLYAAIDNTEYVEKAEHDKVAEELAQVKAALAQGQTELSEQQQIQQMQQKKIDDYGEFFQRFEKAGKLRAEQKGDK